MTNDELRNLSWADEWLTLVVSMSANIMASAGLYIPDVWWYTTWMFVGGVNCTTTTTMHFVRPSDKQQSTINIPSESLISILSYFSSSWNGTWGRVHKAGWIPPLGSSDGGRSEASCGPPRSRHPPLPTKEASFGVLGIEARKASPLFVSPWGHTCICYLSLWM